MSTTRKTAPLNAGSKAAEDMAATATKAAADATQTIHAAVNDGLERMTQGLSNFGSFGQENVEAFIESATTVAKGIEKLVAESTDFARKQFETGSDRFQALSKARTPQEFFEAQSDLFRNSMESQIGQVNKISDMFVATARDAAQPLSRRYSAFVEMMQQR
jgi:phasin family protein